MPRRVHGDRWKWGAAEGAHIPSPPLQNQLDFSVSPRTERGESRAESPRRSVSSLFSSQKLGVVCNCRPALQTRLHLLSSWRRASERRKRWAKWRRSARARWFGRRFASWMAKMSHKSRAPSSLRRSAFGRRGAHRHFCESIARTKSARLKQASRTLLLRVVHFKN